MKILAIETSCDETAAAVVEKQKSGLIRVLGEAVASSEAMHIKTGGIVPEVAAREQVVSIIPVIQETLKQTINHASNSVSQDQSELTNWSKANLDAIAVTQGPGLIGSLLVGVETAKTIAWSWNKPLIPVNHLLGHIYANWIEKLEQKPDGQSQPLFPLLCLIVSGGHTELVLMKDHHDYMIIGGTRDDAAGECFDKCARILGLPYPGGPHISKLATNMSGTHKHPDWQSLPRPLLHEDTLDMSFSGLKAAFVRQVKHLSQDNHLNQHTKQILAADLETAIAEVLSKKVSMALDSFNPKSFLLAGGVAANPTLRNHLEGVCQSHQIPFFKPPQKYCIDNAVMIGAAAIYRHKTINPVQLKVNPGLHL